MQTFKKVQRSKMSHNVTSNDQSGGITAGEVSGDAVSSGGDTAKEDEKKGWGQVVYWVVGGLGAIAGTVTLILKLTGTI